MSEISALSVSKIVSTFTTGSIPERVAFVEACPPTPMREQALLAAKMDMREMRAQTLDFLVQGYSMTGPYDFGAKIGEASYHLAREQYDKGIGDPTTHRLIAGRGAINWMTCLQQVGRHRDITKLVQEPIQWLESIGDKDNIDSLRLKLVESYVDLEDYDEAQRRLDKINESNLPTFVKISYQAIKARIEHHKGGGTSLPEEESAPSMPDIRKILGPIIGDDSSH